MAQNPIGTIADEERLVALLVGDEGFYVDVSDPVRTADLPEEGHFAWRLREEGDAPRLALVPVEDPDETDASFVRPLETDGDALTIAVPDPLVADGLGIDATGYDPDEPLLFEHDELDEGAAVGGTPTGEPSGAAGTALELHPVRFGDGTPYRDEPAADTALDSDPIAEAELDREGRDGTPQTGTIAAPIDPVFVDEVVEPRDVPRDAVVDALEAVARGHLVDLSDDAPESDPPALDDERALVSLAEERWRAGVASELDADAATLDAVRTIYRRQAADLLPPEADRERLDEYVPVVIAPDRT